MIKSRNNSKNSRDHQSSHPIKNYTSSTHHLYQRSGERQSFGISPKPKSSTNLFSTRNGTKKKANMLKQLPIVSPGIRSTLSSLNMKPSMTSSSNYSVNMPSLRSQQSKRPPKAFIEKGYKKCTTKETNSPIKKVSNCI